jgi:hypothetical protein
MMQNRITIMLTLGALLCLVLTVMADQIVTLSESMIYTIKDDSFNSYQSKAVNFARNSSQLYVSGTSSLATRDSNRNEGIWMWRVNTIDGTISEIELKNVKNVPIKIFDVQCLQNTNNGTIVAVITAGNDQPMLVRIDVNGEINLLKKLATESDISSIIPTIDNMLLLIGHKSLNSFIIKINDNGTEIWTKEFNRGKHENFVDGIATNDGGFILIENSGKFEKLFMGECSLFVSKFDSNGNKVDERFLPGRYGSIAQGKDGRFAVVYDKKADSSQDIWVQAYDKQLSPLWSQNITTTKLGFEKFKAAGLTNGNYVISGTVKGKPWVTYLDSNGTKKWDYLSVSKDFENGIDILANGDDCYLISTVMRFNADKALNNYVKAVKFRPN